MATSRAFAKGAGPVLLAALTPLFARPAFAPESAPYDWAGYTSTALIVLAVLLLLIGAVLAIGERRRLQEAPRNLNGIWRSSYEYGLDRHDEHYVVLRQSGRRVRGRSLPHVIDSILELDLDIASPAIAQGTWRERTSPGERYEGQTFFGVIHLRVDPFQDTLTGKWVGFGRSPDAVNTGEWQLTRVETKSGYRKRKEYSNRPYTYGVGFND